MYRIYHREATFVANGFEVCKTSKLPTKRTFLRSFCVAQKKPKSTRSVPSRQGRTFHRKVTKAAVPPEKAAKPQEKSRSDKSCCGSNRKCRRGRRKSREAAKGFNFVRAKPPLRRAESRFAEPRSFPVRETVLFFSLVRKERGVPQRFANLWTPGTIQISARFIIFAEVTGVHHVPGRAGHCKLSGYRR